MSAPVDSAMDRVTFTVPGVARGKGRPRATRRGPFVRLYTDAKTASYENLVALAAREAMDGAEPFDAPVEMTVRVRLTPPKASAPKTLAMLDGRILPAKKPDLTNIIKAVEDGCNAIVYRDDALIVSLSAAKVYSPTPGVDVIVRPASATPAIAHPAFIR